MDLTKLDMFVRVSELGSLAKASLHYNIGPSALSRQLAALETEFHGRLLHRTGRGVRLTELGERVLPRAKALLEDAAALRAEIADSAGVCRGTVHVACLPVIAAPLITRVVRLARQRYPEVVIHASEGLRGQMEHGLAEGTIDIAFVGGLVSERAAEDPLVVSSMCLVGPPGDRLCSAREIDFKMLDGLPIVQPAAADPFRQAIAETAGRLGVRLNVVAEIDSIHLMRDMAAAGVGYALLSLLSIDEQLKAGQISAARVVNPEIKRAIYLIASSRKAESLAVREVTRLIRQVAQELAEAGVWNREH